MVYITQIHLEGGERHEHIASLRWRNPDDGATDQSTRAQMVEWINQGGDARVTDGVREVVVRVVAGNPPYLRTVADGVYTDNLLALPRY
jgi:Protein of unknown function (DUF3892)